MTLLADLGNVKRGTVIAAKMRIAGREVGGDRVIEVRNPYTGALVGTVPCATVEDIRSAFAIARGYRATLTRFERAEILDRAAAPDPRPRRCDLRSHHGRVRHRQEGFAATKWAAPATSSRSPATPRWRTTGRSSRAT